MKPRSLGLVAVLAMVVVSCGGSNDVSPTTSPDDSAANDATDDGGGSDGASSSGTSFGEFTIEGTIVRFAMSDVTASNVEGFDVTFEKCDANFFGLGLGAVGYPVDDNGDLVLGDDGEIVGTLNITLPHEGTDPGLFDIDIRLVYDPLGIDLIYNVVSGSEVSYTIDDNGAVGTMTLADDAGELIVVDFEIVCGS